MAFHETLPPSWSAALLAIVLGAVAGVVLRALLLRFLLPLAERTSAKFDELLVRAVATPAGLTLFFAGLWRAAVVLRPQYGPTLDKTFVSVLIVVWGWSLASLVARGLLHAGKGKGGETHRRGALLLGRFSKIVVAIVLVLTLLAVWNVSITPLIAGAGIAGIALALAAQETLANLFAGVAVYMDRIYEVGDYVVLDEGSGRELRGEVKDVGLRSTRILTRDDVLIVVPNSVIANGRVVNESAVRGRYRVRVPVQVAYESDLDQVERVLTKIGLEHPAALDDPEPRARVRSFDDSGITCELLVWIKEPPMKGVVVHELAKTIHASFRREGITIPFPQRDVHFYDEGQRQGQGQTKGQGRGQGEGRG